MEEFLKLCNEYKNEYGDDITYLNTYLFLDEAIEFIKNRDGKKIDIVVDYKSQDVAIPIYVD